MSSQERTGTRDLLYSKWHREASIRRFLPARCAYDLGMIDIDACEYCRYCNLPLALVETQRSTFGPKSATVTEALARLAGLPAFSVSYRATEDGEDIAEFRVQQITPAQGEARRLTPAEYAEWLLSLRFPHNHSCRKQQEAV